MLRKSLFLGLFFSFLTVSLSSAQSLNFDKIKIIDSKPAKFVCNLPPTDTNAHFFVKASPKVVSRMKKNKVSSTFEFDYVNSCSGSEWPEDAKTAFEYALDIWGEHVRSDVPVKVNANWTELSSTNLGNGRPTQIVQVSGTGMENTWYTLAELSALTGRAIRDEISDSDGNPVEYDIEMNVNCTFDDWYFGTDANVPQNKSDFVTVIVHEIGHGLGFLGSIDADNDAKTAEWKYDDPIIYDRFVVDGDYNHLQDESVYTDPSAELYSAITGYEGGIYFDGTATNNSLVGHAADRARLYSPDPFNEGSTYSHFDQVTFRQTINALMVPFLDRTFALHTPGPLFCGVLSDMGWPLGQACLDFLQSPVLVTSTETLNFGVVNIGDTAQMTLQITNSEEAELTLEGTLEVSGDGFILLGDNEFSLEPGESFEVGVSYSPDNSTRKTGSLTISHNALNETNPLVIPLNGEALDEEQIVELNQSYPNPFVVSGNQSSEKPVIEYAISRDSQVKLDLYSVSGQLLKLLVDGQQEANRYKVPVDLTGYSSGIYIYRIVVDGVTKSGKLMYVN